MSEEIPSADPDDPPALPPYRRCFPRPGSVSFPLRNNAQPQNERLDRVRNVYKRIAKGQALHENKCRFVVMLLPDHRTVFEWFPLETLIRELREFIVALDQRYRDKQLEFWSPESFNRAPMQVYPMDSLHRISGRSHADGDRIRLEVRLAGPMDR
jgi:hypothetical protein